jgi:hypothetical protein
MRSHASSPWNKGRRYRTAGQRILFGAEALRCFAEEGWRIACALKPSSRPDVKSVVGSAAVGVVAAIVPWSCPVDLLCWKVAPALTAGCSMIAKPLLEMPLAISYTCERDVLTSIDTTFDTTQSATCRNIGQPPAKISAYISGFCNIRQPLETGVSGLWL